MRRPSKMETCRKPVETRAAPSGNCWKLGRLRGTRQGNLQEALKSLKIPQETIAQKSCAQEAKKVPRGFEPRSLDSESRVLTVTPRDQLPPSRNRGPRAFLQIAQHLPMLCRPPASGAANVTDALVCWRWLLAHSCPTTKAEAHTPGQDRTGDLQRVRLTS